MGSSVSKRCPGIFFISVSNPTQRKDCFSFICSKSCCFVIFLSISSRFFLFLNVIYPLFRDARRWHYIHLHFLSRSTDHFHCWRRYNVPMFYNNLFSLL